MPTCKKCGKKFERRQIASNQIYCSDCSFWKRYEGGSPMKALLAAEPRLQAAADASGNPKIWRAGECSQKFLRSLIPSRQ